MSLLCSLHLLRNDSQQIAVQPTLTRHDLPTTPARLGGDERRPFLAQRLLFSHASRVLVGAWPAHACHRAVGAGAHLNPANASELAGIAREVGAEVVEDTLRHQSGTWQLGDVDLVEQLGRLPGPTPDGRLRAAR